MSRTPPSADLICAFTYEGEAVPKGRPRFSVFRGIVRTYTPKATEVFEGAVRSYAMLAMRRSGLRAPVDAPVAVTITITRKVPPSWSGRKQREALGQPVRSKPDLDNQAKAILDGMNGTVYLDDAQIAELHLTRHFGEHDRFTVRVTVAGCRDLIG